VHAHYTCGIRFSRRWPWRWNIMPYSPLKVNRRFGGTCRLQLQGPRISNARNQREAGSRQSSDWRQRRLQGVISQKMELFVTTAVRTSNPTWRLLSSGIWHRVSGRSLPSLRRNVLYPSSGYILDRANTFPRNDDNDLLDQRLSTWGTPWELKSR
jgi:hypothetical protein